MAAYGSPSEKLGADNQARPIEARRATHIGITVLLPVLLGVVAGITKTPAFKTSLQIPGHSVIWWFAPILAAKLIAGRHYSATLAGLAAGCILAPFAHGAGRFLGPSSFALAGVVTDVLGVALRLRARSGLPLLLSAVTLGVAANLSRFPFMLLARGPHWYFTPLGLVGRLMSYIVFGALTGAIVACAVMASTRRAPSLK